MKWEYDIKTGHYNLRKNDATISICTKWQGRYNASVVFDNEPNTHKLLMKNGGVGNYTCLEHCKMAAELFDLEVLK